MAKRNAEGAQGMTTAGPWNKFPFRGVPSNPNIDPRQEADTSVAEGYLDQIPGHGDSDIQHGKFPDIPIA